MKKLTIARDELANALRDYFQVNEHDPDVFTTPELAEMFGVSERSARRRAEELVAAGRAERVKTRRESESGRSVPCMGFRFFKE